MLHIAANNLPLPLHKSKRYFNLHNYFSFLKDQPVTLVGIRQLPCVNDDDDNDGGIKKRKKKKA